MRAQIASGKLAGKPAGQRVRAMVPSASIHSGMWLALSLVLLLAGAAHAQVARTSSGGGCSGLRGVPWSACTIRKIVGGVGKAKSKIADATVDWFKGITARETRSMQEARLRAEDAHRRAKAAEAAHRALMASRALAEIIAVLCASGALLLTAWVVEHLNSSPAPARSTAVHATAPVQDAAAESAVPAAPPTTPLPADAALAAAAAPSSVSSARRGSRDPSPPSPATPPSGGAALVYAPPITDDSSSPLAAPAPEPPVPAATVPDALDVTAILQHSPPSPATPPSDIVECVEHLASSPVPPPGSPPPPAPVAAMPEAATSPTATAVAATTAVSPTAAVAAKPGATLEPTTLPTVHTTHPTTDVGSSKNLKDVKVAAMPEASPGGVKPFREYLLEALGSPGLTTARTRANSWRNASAEKRFPRNVFPETFPPKRFLPEQRPALPAQCSGHTPHVGVQGYLAHKKAPPPRTLQQAYALGPMVVLGGEALSYERGTHVGVV
ncbi:hypothetical protein T484DRAFT_1901603 [Baffinella frigidus]|nr:hypothetical protein T484DRAFT_1901603 [Cryptophyta sp. CCMP2293]